MGDVYFSYGATSVALGLPGGTTAFYFYAEPDSFKLSFDITAEANDGTSLPLNISGDGGARGYGFHATLGSSLTSVTVSSTVTFAVGEFGIAVPEPEACAVIAGLGLMGFGLWRRVRTDCRS